MATIRKRGSHYHVQIRRKGHQPLTKSFGRKQDAEAWSRKVESEIERGIFLDVSEAQQTTLAEALERYATEVLPSKKSQHKERSKIKLLSEKLGCYVLSNVKSSVVAEYRDARLKQVNSQTVRRELAVLSHVFTVCIKDWGINLPHGNPVANVRMPKLPQGRTRRIQAEEEARLCWAMSASPTVLSMFKLAIETACRREELCNIEWSDLDLKARTLHIPKTKTDTPRTIPLSTKAVSILQLIPRNINGRVFDIKPDSVTQCFDRACKRSGIEGLRFHDLRHEATSRFFEKGLNVMEVSSITGHKDLRMLARYTHLKAEDLAVKLR